MSVRNLSKPGKYKINAKKKEKKPLPDLPEGR